MQSCASEKAEKDGLWREGWAKKWSRWGEPEKSTQLQREALSPRQTMVSDAHPTGLQWLHPGRRLNCCHVIHKAVCICVVGEVVPALAPPGLLGFRVR